MTTQAPNADRTPAEPQPIGILAEFSDAAALVAAARAMREKDFGKLDAHTPYPIHELDEALEIRPSLLPWLALGAGATGGAIALAVQWWTNAVDYAYIISGKPLFSWQANLPITFEAIILSAALAVFLGLFVLIGLPKLANPLLANQAFLKATTDGYFLSIMFENDSPVPAGVIDELRALGAVGVETVEASDSSRNIPRLAYVGLVFLLIAALLPPLLILRSRATTSRQSPLRSFKDMDFQPKFKSQTRTKLFADGRAMRPPVEGTVARGQLQDDDAFYRGIHPSVRDDAFTSISLQQPDDAAGNEAPPVTNTDKGYEPSWVESIPMEITDEMMRSGRESYNIHCAVCHGRSGDGNGPVSVRALPLEQGTWVPPTSIHAEHVREQPVGQLFHTITNGVRKMPGYADQIRPADRWAIVLYLRALQRGRNASAADLPPEELSKLRDLN